MEHKIMFYNLDTSCMEQCVWNAIAAIDVQWSNDVSTASNGVSTTRNAKSTASNGKRTPQNDARTQHIDECTACCRHRKQC